MEQEQDEHGRLFSPTVPPLERFDRYFDYVHDIWQTSRKVRFHPWMPMLSIGSEVSTQDQGVRAIVERIWDRKIKFSSPLSGRPMRKD